MGTGGGGNGEPGGACGGRGRLTWGGSGVPGCVGGSGSGGGGGWVAGGGRERGTWGGGGTRGGARGSGSDESGVAGGRGGTWGSGSGASGWSGGAVGSVGAVGECAVRGGSGSAAVCGTGPRRSSRASPEASAAPGGPRAVPWGGEVPRRPWGPFGHRMVAGGVRGLARCRLGGEVPRRPWGPFGHRMVAAGSRLVRGWSLVQGGWLLAVGGVCGWGARWLPSRPLVLFVYGGLWPGGVGRWAVVVVGVVLVVVVPGPLVVPVWVVVGLVLRVFTLWVFWSPLWGWGVGHRGQSPGLHYVVGMGEGLGAGLDGDGG